MAKELPYFRFTPQEWQNGDIGIESYELKGIFIDVCSFYWVKDCSITKAMLKKRFKDASDLIDQLFLLGILKDKQGSEFIEIFFLDEQFDVLSKLRKARQEAGSKGGKQKSSKAKASTKQNSSYKDKDKDKDKDNSFDFFWDEFHKTTGKNKTDREAALKYWVKLTEQEKEKAVKSISPYFNSIDNPKFVKKARTYLSDKNFNDEFKQKSNRAIGMHSSGMVY